MSKEESKPKSGGGCLSLLPRALVVLAVAVAVFSGYLVQTAQLPSKQFSVKYDEPQSLRSLDVNKLAERLAAAVRIKTVSRVRGVMSHPEGFLHLHKLLEDFFPLVHKRLQKEIVSNYTLLYTWTPSAPVTRKPVMLASHLDVVPAAERDFDDWDYEPFAGHIIDGYIYGRGTMDDKIGVLGILEAAEMLLAEGFEPPCVIYFTFGHDEELGGESGAAKVVELLKSRGVTLNFAVDEGGFVTHGLMHMVKEPLAMIAVAEKGYVTLELSVKGKGGHSSSPPIPQTPVGILSNAIARLEANQFKANLDCFNIMVNYIAPHVPLALRVPLVHQWLFAPLLEFQLTRQSSSAALVRTVISPTMLEASEKENVLPTLAKGTVNFRILLGDSVSSVADHVRSVINDDRVEVVESVRDPAQEPSPISPPEAPQFSIVQKTIHQILPDVLVTPMVTIGMTDSRYFYALTPNVYRFLPVKLTPTDVNRFHGINERVSLDDVRNAVRFYYMLMRNTVDLPVEQ